MGNVDVHKYRCSASWVMGVAENSLHFSVVVVDSKRFAPSQVHVFQQPTILGPTPLLTCDATTAGVVVAFGLAPLQ